MRCANCGAESHPEGLSLCPVCGAQAARRWRQEVRCPDCGRYVAAGLRVCTFCGATLQDKPGYWGLALLCLIAALAVTFSVQRYGLGQEVLSAVGRAPAAAISKLSEWKERLFSVEWEEGALPTPAPNRAP
jgi:hypothetical protein